MKAIQPPRRRGTAPGWRKLHSPLFIFGRRGGARGAVVFCGCLIQQFFDARVHPTTAFVEGHGRFHRAQGFSGQSAGGPRFLDNQLVARISCSWKLTRRITDDGCAKAIRGGRAGSSYKLALAGFELMRVKSNDRRGRRSRNPRPTQRRGGSTAARAKAGFERSQELRKQNTGFRNRNLTARRLWLNRRGEPECRPAKSLR